MVLNRATGTSKGALMCKKKKKKERVKAIFTTWIHPASPLVSWYASDAWLPRV